MKGTLLFLSLLLAACNGPQPHKAVNDNELKVRTFNRAELVKFNVPCENWQLDTLVVATILQHLNPVKRAKSYEYSDNSPCGINGIFSRNDSVFGFYINSKAGVTLWHNEKIYGTYVVDSMAAKYFVQLADSNNLKY